MYNVVLSMLSYVVEQEIKSRRALRNSVLQDVVGEIHEVLYMLVFNYPKILVFFSFYIYVGNVILYYLIVVSNNFYPVSLKMHFEYRYQN